jgi:hypothetical protein
MATPFSRTIRSLESDNYYFSLIGLLIAIVLAMLWGYWFFTAKIVSYETSQDLQVTDEKMIIHQFPKKAPLRVQEFHRRFLNAYFPLTTLSKIHPGQKAWVHLQGEYGQSIHPLPAKVARVLPAWGTKPAHAVLQLDLDSSTNRLVETGMGGEVKIEVQEKTPAQFVLHAAGLLNKTPQLSSSPQ